MTDQTVVNFLHMEDAQGHLMNVVTQLDKITDDLYKNVQNILSEHWFDSNSGARTMFDEERSKWDVAEQQMGNDLHQAAQALGIANSNYQAAEDFNRKLWSQA
ncbi:WXG100 family type VII secretion target [Nonomuraea sp. NPDC050536]|uniref:WXG100 family type VII secretion target n=1 Tax=Nonomuraea sp. NPDC050536 TaxID=3364366 RepID=UPI0037CC285F